MGGRGDVGPKVPEAVRSHVQAGASERRDADDVAKAREGFYLRVRGVFRLLSMVLGIHDDVPEGTHGTVASVAFAVVTRSLRGRQEDCMEAL